MKTVVVTRKFEEGYRVGILHRAKGDLLGGVIVAWLTKAGCFSMPTSPEAAKAIKHFGDSYAAEKVAHQWLSMLRFVAEAGEL